MKFWSRKKKEQELDDEVRSHLEMSASDRVERGESPDDANHSAQKEFGNVGLVKEITRDLWGWNWMEVTAQNLRYAMRMLRKNPGFTTIAVLTLTLGIGASTALFSVVSAVLLEPLPFAQADRLVFAQRKNPGSLRTIASYPDFTDWQQSGVFQKSAAGVGRGFFLDTNEGLKALSGRRVSEEFFETLGVRPALGRDFLPGEVRNGENVAIVSHKFWTTHMGGEAQAVGKDLRLRDQTFRVIGVLPVNFLDPISAMAPRDLYVPLIVSKEERVARNSQWIQIFGRLRDGVSLPQAAAQVEALSTRAQRETAGGGDPRRLSPFTLVTLHDYQVGDTEPALWLLFGAVGFVLLIGCANVSNLVLARVTSRNQELAVRAAVGASARRLAAQLMTESLLLSFAGGALALVFTIWTIDLVKAVSPVNIPRLETAGLDLRVFGFALLTTVAAGLLFGLLPMLRGTRQDVLSSLKQANNTGGVTHARSRSALLIAEVALTMILLVGATLAGTSLQKLLQVDPGFQIGDVLTVNLTYAGQWKQPQQYAFFQQLMSGVRTLPGVRAAGAVDNLPFSGAWSQFTMTMKEFAADGLPEEREKTVEYQQGVVAGDYFRVMGVPLKAGRLFDERDAAGSASVIVSESLARAVWGSLDPIGRQVSDGQTRGARVVGVVGNVRHFGPDTQLVQTLYRPMAQREAWGGTLVVLAEQDAATLVPSIREKVRSLDRAVVFQRAQSMDDLAKSRTSAPRFLAVLLGSFGGVALILAVIGIYGVLAYSVNQRRREIGVRIALGAQPGRVLWMVIRNGMSLAGIGVAIGLAGAVVCSRFLREQLFGVSSTDPLTYAGVAALLSAVALLACWIPARRAAHVDPMVALRYE